jgi:hypothetical protein
MNKILVVVYVPSLEERYDVFIPINKKVGTIKKVIIDTINELSSGSLKNKEKLKLYNKDDCKIYNNNVYVKNSEIVNGTELLLI